MSLRCVLSDHVYITDLNHMFNACVFLLLNLQLFLRGVLCSAHEAYLEIFLYDFKYFTGLVQGLPYPWARISVEVITAEQNSPSSYDSKLMLVVEFEGSRASCKRRAACLCFLTSLTMI